jgi:hypothetical protein
LRVFFAFNLLLWCVLFLGWLGYVALMGLADPVSVRVGFVLAITAALLTVQGVIRWRRHRRVRVSA